MRHLRLFSLRALKKTGVILSCRQTVGRATKTKKKLQSISSDRKGEEKVLGVIDVKKTEEEREGKKSTKAAPAAEGTDAISRFGDGFAK